MGQSEKQEKFIAKQKLKDAAKAAAYKASSEKLRGKNASLAQWDDSLKNEERDAGVPPDDRTRGRTGFGLRGLI